MAFAQPSYPVEPAALPMVEEASWRRTLEQWHERYDPAERMIRRPFSSPGYHTTLAGGEVHPTRDSLAYAVALLDSGEPELVSRAEDVLLRVIALQDTDPASRTFGIWPWFLEEPLAEMAPPDWNWADFCGVQLLQALLHHRDRLSAATIALLETAVAHAAEAIRRRDVGPHYTNIALMSAYVTLLAGQTLSRLDLTAYGQARLQRFSAYTDRHGSFTEYNSPTYTVVALKELWRLANHVLDPVCRQLAARLYEQAWRHIARRYHAPSGQWSGPHSRAYTTLLSRETASFLQAATGHVLQLVSAQDLDLGLDWVRVPARYPAAVLPAFTTLAEVREETEVFWRPDPEDPRPAQIGVTYLTPHFSLGSVNRADLWNQRRPVIAYWGTTAQPSYLRLRCIKDGYDFAAAQVFVAQAGGDALIGVVVATDGGDRHVSLDRLRDGTFTAGELTLRLEVGGAAAAQADRWPVVWDGRPVEIDLGTVHIGVAAPWAQSGVAPIRYGVGRSGDVLWLDLVLYLGDVRTITVDELAASVVLALSVTDERQLDDVWGARPIAVAKGDDHVEARWPRARGTLTLILPVTPASTADLHRQARAFVERQGVN